MLVAVISQTEEILPWPSDTASPRSHLDGIGEEEKELLFFPDKTGKEKKKNPCGSAIFFLKGSTLPLS